MFDYFERFSIIYVGQDITDITNVLDWRDSSKSVRTIKIFLTDFDKLAKCIDLPGFIYIRSILSSALQAWVFQQNLFNRIMIDPLIFFQHQKQRKQIVIYLRALLKTQIFYCHRRLIILLTQQMFKPNTQRHSIKPTSMIQHFSQSSVQEKEEIVGAQTINYDFTSACPCPFCLNFNNLNCFACKGKGTLSQENQFSKFVSAIVDYKIGRSKGVQQELPTKTHQTSGKQSILNTLISSNDSKIEEREISQKYSYNNRSSIEGRLSAKLPQHQVVHQGIQCDSCHEWPIIGIRYKCSECSDYDLCSKCFHLQKHQHKNFDSILRPKRDYQKQKLRESVHTENVSDCLKLSSILQKVHNFFA